MSEPPLKDGLIPEIQASASELWEGAAAVTPPEEPVSLVALEQVYADLGGAGGFRGHSFEELTGAMRLTD